MRGPRVNKESYILRRSRGASCILHVGCTSAPNTPTRWRAGTLLHKKLCDEANGSERRIVGIDIDETSLEWLRERMPGAEIIYADAQRLDDYFASDLRFDLIIAGDVIEHLPNPGLFLASCRSRLTPDGRILLTTVNAFGIARFLKAVLNHEAVHSEHTAYYSHKTLTRLCAMCGLRPVALGYYRCEPLTGPSLNRILTNGVEHVLALPWPQFSEGVLMEAAVA